MLGGFRVLTGTLFAAIALVTYEEIYKKNRVPHPQSFGHVIIVWSILGVIAELGVPEIAGLFGVGLLLSMAYSYLANPEADAVPPAANDAAAK